MSKEDVHRFFKAGESAPELKAKFQSLATPEQFAEAASAEGYEFSTEDLESVLGELRASTIEREQGELSEAELEAAAGGLALYRTGGLSYLGKLKVRNLNF